MSLKFGFVALALLATAPSAMAIESLTQNREVADHLVTNVVGRLASNGIVVTDVEKAGDAIRVIAEKADGTNYFMTLDKDSLLPLDRVNAVGTRLDVGTDVAPAAGRPTTSFLGAETLSPN